MNVPPKGGRKHPHQEFIEINTKNILFICGGSFFGLEKLIQKRLHKKTVGFDAEIQSRKHIDVGLFKQTIPDDLVRFGMIPEIVGRIPVIGALHELDEKALVEIFDKTKKCHHSSISEII